MKIKLIISSVIFIVFVFLNSCELGIDENPESTLTTISGQVVDSESGNPVVGATVKVYNDTSYTGGTTNSNGLFQIDFNINNDQELNVVIYKSGYLPDTLNIYITSGSENNISLVKLVATTGSGNGKSGQAASLYLYSQSAASIGVKESGALEAAQIVFQVLDSSGVPITFENKVYVQFSFLSGPGGGEYLYPDSVESNSLGRATVTLNSGTVAGVVQVIARINSINGLIQSQPVALSIFGGIPDINHFDIASENLNYPAYGIVGFSISFTAYVGDKYSNPVRPNTTVYFSTTSGIIGGSAQTSTSGTATVELLTQPFPNHNEYGLGFFEVTASTIDENSELIQTSSIRLLSGYPVLNVSPNSINITNGGNQVFVFQISDSNGNPLAEGTRIAVTVEEGDIDLSGDIDVTLPDTQSSFYTQFSFTAYDSEPGTELQQNAMIEIQCSSPNGNQMLNITGITR